MHVIPTRLLPREFIKFTTQDNYIAVYLNIKLAGNPYRPYSAKTNIDQHIDIWNSPKEVVIEKLNNDAKIISQAADLPFNTIEKLTAENSENIHQTLAELQQTLPELLPLIADEIISTTAIYYLNTEWEGLAAGTIIFYRKTNYSEIYFALPDMQINLQTDKLQNSLISTGPTKPVNNDENPEAVDNHSNEDSVIMLAAVAADNSNASLSSEITVNSVNGFDIFNLAAGIVTTLAWTCPPAAPFIGAGVAVVSFIVNLFNPGGPNYIELMGKAAEKITTDIENYIQQQDIAKKTSALVTFSELVSNLKPLLNIDSALAYKQAITEPGGLLARFNDHITGENDNALNALIVALMNDSDIKPSDTIEVYSSFTNWVLAKNKMDLLLYAISNYLLAIKIKIALVDKLYEYGIDEHGHSTTEQNRTTYFALLKEEAKKFQTEIPKYINYLQERRLKMVSKPTSASTKAVVSYNYRMPGDEGSWFQGGPGILKVEEHDALWFSYYKPNQLCSYLVRDAKDKYETKPLDIKDPHILRPSKPIPPYKYFEASLNNWERLEITDYTVDSNNTVVRFVLHDYKSGLWGDTHWDGYGYLPNHVRANKFYADYIADVKKLFEVWNSLPAKWSEGVAEWGRKISPFIPKDATARLILKSWEGKADPAKDANELWLDKALEVRYLFSLKTGGHESELSSDTISTPWIYAEQRKNPLIEGFPIEGDFLEYVNIIKIYRQCRINADKVTKPRPIKLLTRDKETKKFPESFQDQVSTSKEKEELNTLNNNAISSMSAIGVFAPTATKSSNQGIDEVDTTFSAQPK